MNTKTAILYYSFSGYTRSVAEELSVERGADLFEIKEANRRGTFNAYLTGSRQAAKQIATDILPINCIFTDYDKFILAAPIWWGFPAPAFNAALALLPKGAKIEIVLTSGSGNSDRGKAKVKAKVLKQGGQLVSYTDIKKTK